MRRSSGGGNGDGAPGEGVAGREARAAAAELDVLPDREPREQQRRLPLEGDARLHLLAARLCELVEDRAGEDGAAGGGAVGAAGDGGHEAPRPEGHLRLGGGGALVSQSWTVGNALRKDASAMRAWASLGRERSQPSPAPRSGGGGGGGE